MVSATRIEPVTPSMSTGYSPLSRLDRKRSSSDSMEGLYTGSTSDLRLITDQPGYEPIAVPESCCPLKQALLSWPFRLTAKAEDTIAAMR
jgi:hypothetical protein